MPDKRTNQVNKLIAQAKSRIIQQTEECLQNSLLRMAVHDSSRTQSKYINLYFPERNQNADPYRQPFTVRISDHANASLFHTSQPNAEIVIAPSLSHNEKKYLDNLNQAYEALSLELIKHPEQHSRIQSEREAIHQMLKEACSQVRYGYQISQPYTTIDEIIAQMNELLIAHTTVKI